jgi:hypothetical protein
MIEGAESGGRDAPDEALPVSPKTTERITMTGTTITHIRRRRFVRALELAVLGFVMSLLALSLERSLAARSRSPLQHALR